MMCEAKARVEREARTRRRADFIVKWMDSDEEREVSQWTTVSSPNPSVFNMS